jgi:hypothetical protein
MKYFKALIAILSGYVAMIVAGNYAIYEIVKNWYKKD